ncbi:hypothetical protein HAX54_048020, partial [Datura stramonium]|nr:hypothetical protein [Datura stramonium]
VVRLHVLMMSTRYRDQIPYATVCTNLNWAGNFPSQLAKVLFGSCLVKTAVMQCSSAAG